MYFGSDNSAGVAPEILKALGEVNEGAMMAYGEDAVTDEVRALFSEVFEKDVTVFLVATGSAANSLGLSVMSPPFGAIFCHEAAHIMMHECGAPEFFTGGAKLVGLPGADGKIDASKLDGAIRQFPKGWEHVMQPSGLSISQATEWGAAYSVSEIEALSAIAKSHGMPVHMDGARFANALVHLACTPAQMTWKAGIDVLSFGATKNGAMAAEAVVFFDEAQVQDFKFRQKRGGHLFSKSRYPAAQFLAYFKEDLWLRLAGHANGMAQKLAERLDEVEGCAVQGAPETNQVFVAIDADQLAKWQSAGVQLHVWSEVPGTDQTLVRLVTSHSSEEAHIDQLIAIAKG